MSGWAIVAVVAIVVWGMVQMFKARHRAERGIIMDERGNESFANAPRDGETEQEIEDLRERIKVLERIATDGNSLDAQETKRISAEIEALRDKQPGQGE
ncbi:hypothetical protein [Qipengyuania gelatinilytica]|uniref:SHOCT domain-containing protein n=1 Tax=Qipengyuania gelatinilytica TaxID=2867231 RepID=A0ABX9A4X8_9SPHN|nr:hypothetical protein [Qipengyuania gelatinilytica]QZD96091.1 hypothetical protein K3136_05140 [Qipengyuania gelatinilytica]